MERLFQLLTDMSDRIRALENKLSKQETNTTTHVNDGDGEESFDSVAEFQKFIQSKKAAIAKEQEDIKLLRSKMM